MKTIGVEKISKSKTWNLIRCYFYDAICFLILIAIHVTFCSCFIRNGIYIYIIASLLTLSILVISTVHKRLARWKFYTQDQFHSLLETSFGYTGVNIKIPITDNITELKIKRVQYNSKKKNPWVVSEATYEDYLDLLPIKEKDKKLKKDRYNTFLVFHSGKVIMSGMTSEFMRKAYTYFLRIMRTCYDDIREKLAKGCPDEDLDIDGVSDLSGEEV